MSKAHGCDWDHIYGGERSAWRALGFLACLAFAVVALDLAPKRGLPVGGDSHLFGGCVLIAATAPAVAFGLRLFFSPLAAISVTTFYLAVGTVTMTLAITTGFEREVRDKVLGMNAHLVVMSRTEQYMLGGVGVSVLSRDPAREGEPPPVIIGTALATALGVRAGDHIGLAPPPSAPNVATWTADAAIPHRQPFRVAGIFDIGFYEYDRYLVLMNLVDAQQFLGWPGQVTGVEAVVRDTDEAAHIANELERVRGSELYMVVDWRELNETLLTAVAQDERDLLPALAVLLAIAPFLAILGMVVVIDEPGDSALLRRMGATSASALRFRRAVLFAAGLGTVLGVAVTLALCEWLESRKLRIDATVFQLDYIPSAMAPVKVLIAAGGTLLLATLLSLLATVRARTLSKRLDHAH